MNKILLIDIETSVNLGAVFQLWNNNLSINQIVEEGWIMSFAAKWIDDDKIMYYECRGAKQEKVIVEEALKLFNKADIVIAHNIAFDVKTIEGKAIKHGLNPPKPFKTICTLRESRKRFKLLSHKLEYLAKYLGCDNEKSKHGKFAGMDLWLQCWQGNNEAWNELKYYNIMDVKVLEDVYLKIRPWIKGHPNIAPIHDTHSCPKCGSHNVIKKGKTKSAGGVYKRYVCKDCGGWSQSRKKIKEVNVNNLKSI